MESIFFKEREGFFVRFRGVGRFDADSAASELGVFRDMLVIDSVENRSSCVNGFIGLSHLSFPCSVDVELRTLAMFPVLVLRRYMLRSLYLQRVRVKPVGLYAIAKLAYTLERMLSCPCFLRSVPRGTVMIIRRCSVLVRTFSY